jgi:hypothetical protein
MLKHPINAVSGDFTARMAEIRPTRGPLPGTDRDRAVPVRFGEQDMAEAKRFSGGISNRNQVASHITRPDGVRDRTPQGESRSHRPHRRSDH